MSDKTEAFARTKIDALLEDAGWNLTDGSSVVLYNRGNSKFALGSFDEAWFDFDAAGKHGEGSDACLAMGNCKVWLGEFEEARHAYTRGLQMSADTSAGHCKKNAAQVGGILQTLGGRAFSLGRNDSNLTVNSQGGLGITPFPVRWQPRECGEHAVVDGD